MPGFNVGGIGGGGPSNTVEPRRKHRWTFEVLGRGSGLWSRAELLLLQSASRPTVEFETVEMHYNQEVASFAGKQSWEPITLVWYDVEQNPDVSKGVYHWIETVSNMTTVEVAAPQFYKKNAQLALLDGKGATTERWFMYGCWPQKSNWQELDMTSNEILTVEVSMKYDRAVRECNTSPAPTPVSPSCPN